MKKVIFDAKLEHDFIKNYKVRPVPASLHHELSASSRAREETNASASLHASLHQGHPAFVRALVFGSTNVTAHRRSSGVSGRCSRPLSTRSRSPSTSRHPPHPGVELRANLKSISHRCHLFEVAFVWELTTETIHLPLGCLQGGLPPSPLEKRARHGTARMTLRAARSRAGGGVAAAPRRRAGII